METTLGSIFKFFFFFFFLFLNIIWAIILHQIIWVLETGVVGSEAHFYNMLIVCLFLDMFS